MRYVRQLQPRTHDVHVKQRFLVLALSAQLYGKFIAAQSCHPTPLSRALS